MKSLMLLVVSLFTFIAVGQAKCSGGCTVQVKHYEEIGCEPVFAKPDDCCPTHYNCAKIEGRAADKCYFKNKVYEKGEHIDNDLTVSNCAAGCFCSKDEWHDLTCANIECPEFFGVKPLQPGCYHVYEDKCCSTKTVCPPFDKLASCKVGDQVYHEGQKFEPPKSEATKCLTCTCKPGFEEGKYVAPFCTEINCGIEVRHSLDVRKKFAPVYYGTDLCCPIQWQSPEDIESVTAAEKASGSGQKCHYGDRELNVGDKFKLKRPSGYSPEVNCECRIPPLVTCIQKPHDYPK